MRSILNTHAVSQWLLDTNKDWPLILLRYCNQLNIIFNPDDVRNWDTHKLSNILR